MRMGGLHGRGGNGKSIGLMFCSLMWACFAVSASAQTGSKQVVRICVPRKLIESEGWEHPAPGSRIQLFRNMIRDYLLEHGDVGSQYRIKEDAFAHFEPGRTTVRDILQVVSANQECPASNYTAALDVSPLDGSAPQQRITPQSPLSEAARNSLLRAWQYQVGQGVPKDPLTAARLYEDAAKQGWPDAMYRLGLMYLDGEGVQQNLGSAVYWFYQAAQRGHTAAQAEVGRALFQGEGAQQNEKAAFEWFLLAARSGLSRAQCAVGILYEGGAGTARSASDAVFWFRKAAEQGELYAMHRLAVHLREGSGVGWNEAEAMQWFRKAADKGFALSQSSLGWGYMKGLGQNAGQGVQDYRQAAYWFNLAAQQGEPHAQVNLGLFYEEGTGVERNLARAKALYEAAANGPDPKVAAYARRFADGLPSTSADTTMSRRRSGGDDKIGAWIAAGAAIVGGAIVLKALFGSGSSSAHSAPPDTSNFSSGTDSNWNTGSSYTPPAPTCRVVQTSTAFEVPQGTALSNPTGPTTVVCD
jgi:TPR repeat protein